MSYEFFQSILHTLGKKLDFEANVNLYGRTVFDKKQGNEINKIIANSNPLYKPSKTGSAAAFLSMPGQMAIIESGNTKQANKALGDISWFKDFLT